MADYVGGDMIRGHIDTIILNSLIDGDKDTNQIRTEIEERADGQFQLKQGTFYSALQRIVKQGYVIEYRSTGSDGTRHKYFQLTEKGKDHIEKTQSSWTMSRQVINTLLDAQQPQQQGSNYSYQEDEKLPAFGTDTPVTDFSNLDKKAEKIEESTAEKIISSLNEIENSIPVGDPLNNGLIDSKNSEENKDLSNNDNNSPIEDKILSEEPLIFKPEASVDSTEEVPQSFDDIMEILEKIDRDEKEEAERKKLENQKLQQQLASSSETIDEKSTENTKITEEKQINVFELQKIKENDELSQLDELKKQQDNLNKSINKLENQINSEQITNTSIFSNDNITDEHDDFLDINNYPVQKEYRDILSKIFAKDEETDKKNVIDFPSSTASVENKPDEDKVHIEASKEKEEKYDVIVDNLEFKTDNRNNSAETNKKNKKDKKSGIDYSDIIALSEKEGFKVSTSDRTNKSELGKILINRLNFHSSVIFFALIAIEILIIGLAMEKVLCFGVPFYICFTLIALIFPTVCGVLYYMAPKRTVAELSQFRSSFETALIITLNLILMILVYTVIIDLDYSNKQALTRHLFLPLIIVLNVPIYVIIRYSLLEKQMYFS